MRPKLLFGEGMAEHERGQPLGRVRLVKDPEELVTTVGEEERSFGHDRTAPARARAMALPAMSVR